MTLVLEIEHLLGVAFAARDQASGAPDWPPQPDRIFSALVATWALRGKRGEERRALEWLEHQAAPEIAASEGFPRTSPTVFVPPNDPQTRKAGDPTIMPASRRRQPRRFPAWRPDDPLVHVIWRDTTPDPAVLAALDAVAADTAYIGHSASLTRCRFHHGEAPAQNGRPRRRVYPGRLAELEREFNAGRRPSPGEVVRAASGETGASPIGGFVDRWLVLEHVDGEMPDLRAAPLIAKTLRVAVMAGYDRIGLGAAIPSEVSGHSADGSPSRAPHLAIAPMAFVGSRFASGAVFGFALIPPRQHNLVEDQDFQRALRAVIPWNDRAARRELRLDRLDLTFTPVGASARRSLDPDCYTADSVRWASVTPILLDRHLKETGNAARAIEIEGVIRQACVNIGLPPPDRVAAGKHSAIEGAPSAYPSGSAPHWLRWRLPESLATRQLTHAVLSFPEPVRGPVILGAGRFLGLGLCRPLGDEARRER